MSPASPTATARVAVERWRGSAPDWDALAAAAAGSTFCHLAGWRTVMEGVMGHECPYLLARDADGAPCGLLPLVRLRSRLFGHHLLSMPFLNYGGPLGTLEAQHRLVEEAVRMAERDGAAHLELRTRHAASTALEPRGRRVAVLLPLPERPEDLWSAFPGKLRSQLRRPIKEGAEVRFGPEECGPFYEVFARNMRDLGTPVLPRALFESLAPTFGERVVFGAVYWQGAPVAAGCGFVHGEEFEMTWASSLREHNRFAPNMLLYWRFMEHLIGRGARCFNFGRSVPGAGTHRFKLQWGGDTIPLPWLCWPERGDAPPSADRPAYRAATRLWSRLPLPVANALGPRLARALPAF